MICTIVESSRQNNSSLRAFACPCLDLGTACPGNFFNWVLKLEFLMAATNDDTVYVAVGKDVAESKLTLSWVLENFHSKKVCVLHVHQPAKSIPLIGVNFPASRLEQHELREFQEFERNIMHKILDDYLLICRQAEIHAKKMYIEMADIGKGIIELIYQHDIKKLVMGAAADKHYSEGMTDLRSNKAKYIQQRVPHSCQVWYIWGSHLILTREGESSCSSSESFGDSASPSEERAEGNGLELELCEVLQSEEDSLSAMQALIEVEKHKREAFEESLRRVEAEKTSIKTICRVISFGLKALESLYNRELKRRKNSEEALAKEKEGHRRMKNLLEEAQLIAKDQNLLYQVQVAGLDHKIKELQVKRDSVQKLAEELANKQVEDTSCSQMHQFLSVFSLSEIQEATRNFDFSLKIGEGRMRHPNLVTLIGACSEVCALIHEYVPNGNLEDQISCKHNSPPLPWQARIRIATELCSALIFLHSSNPYSIVHGDLKPGNILLDANLACKVGDFGICRALPRDVTLCHQTDPKGSFLYLDPHFLTTGELTPKEISPWHRNVIDAGNLQSFLDSLAGDWPFVQAKQLPRLALKCCDINRSSRSDLASEVWRVLEPMRAYCGASPSIHCGDQENQKPPSYFFCPILQEVMQDPKVAADGFTYEAEALTGWLESGHNTSPTTNLELEHFNLISNHSLRSAIQEWQQFRYP
ncbi:receptor protein kinase, putative [Ricinus communis]|uniref:RING-type E3 ubiquitin transferase n=1 Tax=Ricinus communis TaxID=3988 RepID=B9SX07_RICCO|nr:receptor protein kinase, putative [Ricinus communis]